FDLTIVKGRQPENLVVIRPLAGLVPPEARVGDGFNGPFGGVSVDGELWFDSAPALLPGFLDPAIPPPTDRANAFSVATLNLQNFFDSLDDPADPDDNLTIPYVPSNVTFYQQRLNKLAGMLRDGLHYPDVLVLQ